MKYRENIERPVGFWDKKKLTALSGGVAFISAFIGATIVSEATDPVNQYDENFTDTGKCLDDTPYDKDNGATRDTITVDGEISTVRVIPKDANNHDPSVLYITETDQGWYGFGDHHTGTFLVNQACKNIPDGF